MTAIPLNQFSQWNTNYNYAKWDVAYGATAGDTRYFYATTASFGADPRAQFVFSPTQTSRTSNVMRVSFNQTGTIYLQQGSVVVVSGISPDSSANYTGLALAGGAGYVDFLNPGLDTTNAVLAGGVTAPIHPYWTTGFYWIPSWSTEATNNVAVVEAKLGEGYSQRMNPVINSNSLSWNLVFAERTDKETMGMLTFLQVAGGATPFYLNFPIGNIFNQANLKYTAGAPKTSLSSFGLNQTAFSATQVFDIG